MRIRLLLTMSLAAVPGILQMQMPPSCVRDSSVLTCTKLNSFNLQHVLSAVMYEVLIDFIFLNSASWHCSCQVLKLVQLMRVTDVIVVTSSRCELGQFRRCGIPMAVPHPELVAGLVVSSKDPRRKWAIRHHVTNLWYKIKAIKSAATRTTFYKGILQDVRDDIQAFEVRAARRGYPLVLTSVMEDMSRLSIDTKNLWMPVTTTTTTTTTRRTTTTTPKEKVLIRYTPFGHIVFYKGRWSWLKRGRREATLRTGRSGRHRLPSNMTPTGCHEHVGVPSHETRTWSPSQSILTRRKRATSGSPRVVPYKVYAGGAFYSIFNTDGINAALARDGIVLRSGRRRFKKRRRLGGRRYYVSRRRGRRRRGRRRRVRPRKPAAGRRPKPAAASPGRPQGGKWMSQGQIRKITKESDHRMKSFIIFFVATVGMITIIAVLLIMAMRSSREKRGLGRFVSPHPEYRYCPGRQRGDQIRCKHQYEYNMYGGAPLSFYGQDKSMEQNTCLSHSGPDTAATVERKDQAIQTEPTTQRESLGGGPPEANMNSYRETRPPSRPRQNFPYRQLPHGGQYKGTMYDDLFYDDGYKHNINRWPEVSKEGTPMASFMDSSANRRNVAVRRDRRNHFNLNRNSSRLLYNSGPHRNSSRQLYNSGPHRNSSRQLYNSGPHRNMTIGARSGARSFPAKGKQCNSKGKLTLDSLREFFMSRLGGLFTNSNSNNSSCEISQNNRSNTGARTLKHRQQEKY